MPHLRLLVVDKSLPACVRLQGFLELEPGVEVASLQVGNGAEAMAAIERGRPDIVFWDGDLSEGGGAAKLSRLPGEQGPVIVVFGAHPRFAVDAFRIGAVDCLLKPIDQTRCSEALQRAVARVHRLRAAALSSRLANGSTRAGERRMCGRMMVRSKGRMVVVKIADIVWVEAARNRAILHMVDGKAWRLRQSLSTLEQQFRAAKFLRVSRSALVATAHIRELLIAANGARVLAMEGGARLPLRRNGQACIEQLLRGDD